MKNNNITREEANNAAMRLDNISDMLQALHHSSFRSAEEAIIKSKESCYDWIVCNYQLVNSIISELVYLLPEQLDIIETYFMQSDTTEGR